MYLDGERQKCRYRRILSHSTNHHNNGHNPI
jgi:hypothetical protein